MRAVWLIVACACGGKTTPQPPANVRTSPETPATRSAYVENCEPDGKGFEPGNHDRYSFEDPKTGKYGFKTKAGVVAIPAIFDHVASEFSPEGMAGVVSATPNAPSPFLFIDPSGKPIARAYAFDNGPDYFQEGLARIVDDKKRIGYIDERGTIVITPKFTRAAPFCHGKGHVEFALDRYWIDRAGNRVAPPKDAEPDEFVNGDSGA